MARYRYSYDQSKYTKNAPYDLNRSDMRRAYGARAIRSYGPEDAGGPGDMSTRDPNTGFTSDAVWNAYFHRQRPTTGTAPVRQPIGANIPPLEGEAPAPAPTRMTDRFYQGGWGRPQPMTPGGVTSGSVLQTPYGTGSVRSASALTPEETAQRNVLGGMAPSATAGIDLAPTSGPIRLTGEDYLNNVIANAPPPDLPPPARRTAQNISALATPSTWDTPIDDSEYF